MVVEVHAGVAGVILPCLQRRVGRAAQLDLHAVDTVGHHVDVAQAAAALIVSAFGLIGRNGSTPEEIFGQFVIRHGDHSSSGRSSKPITSVSTKDSTMDSTEMPAIQAMLTTGVGRVDELHGR